MKGTLAVMVSLAVLGVAAIGRTVLADLGVALGAVLHYVFAAGERRLAGRVLHPSAASSLVAGRSSG